MAGPFSKLRNFIRNWFTRDSVAVDDKPYGKCQGYNTQDPSQENVLAEMPPSERFVWAMLVLIVALAGLVAIELAIILVTGAVNNEILIVVSGLVGALASRFLEAKR